MHHLYLDLKKAYDLVKREDLHNILVEFSIPMKLVRLIKVRLIETCSRTLVGKNMSNMFPFRNDFKQGDVLSPFFQLCLEYTIRGFR